MWDSVMQGRWFSSQHLRPFISGNSDKILTYETSHSWHVNTISTVLAIRTLSMWKVYVTLNCARWCQLESIVTEILQKEDSWPDFYALDRDAIRAWMDTLIGTFLKTHNKLMELCYMKKRKEKTESFNSYVYRCIKAPKTLWTKLKQK